MKDIEPFKNCPALDGYHCQSNSLAKIYHFYNSSLSEDMILGLGAGMGFMYWQMKIGDSNYVFIGGRGNTKNFFEDLGKRTGVKIKQISTSSEKKAEDALLASLNNKNPIMVFGDMYFLPWFDIPVEYHFGGHTFVLCGYNGKDTVLASDMDHKATGLKKGFYYPISLEQLKKARGSKFKPFPPKNTYLEFDFKNFHKPTEEDIYTSIKQTIDFMLNPPIKNFGVKGMRKTAKMLPKWPGMFSDFELRMNLFSIYIFIEIGGTGGGCFRYMYSRFLKESAEITKEKKFELVSEMINESGKLLTEVGELFKESETVKDISDRIEKACHLFEKIADKEEETYKFLSNIIR
jgi:hypothetical protein